MEDNKTNKGEQAGRTPQKKTIHSWSDFDFTNISVNELAVVINMLHQRICTLENITYARDQNGNIISDPQGTPLTLTKFYRLQAEEQLKEQQRQQEKKEKENKTAEPKSETK